jgi:hypothetical protein
MSNLWLIEEAKAPDEAAIRQLERELPTNLEGVRRGAQKIPNLAIRVQDVIIHDNKKWFGETEIRVDALIVHGNGAKNKLESFYMPQTFRFPRVVDGDRLPTGEAGLLIFYGQPLFFLDIFVMVSRDRKDSDDLANLITRQINDKEVQGAMGVLLGLAIATPQVAAVTAAIGASAILGNFAYQVLRQATGTTVGLYHTSWLQHRDKFGIGRHPEKRTYNEKDLSFWYEIVIDETPKRGKRPTPK